MVNVEGLAATLASNPSSNLMSSRKCVPDFENTGNGIRLRASTTSSNPPGNDGPRRVALTRPDSLNAPPRSIRSSLAILVGNCQRFRSHREALTNHAICKPGSSTSKGELTEEQERYWRTMHEHWLQCGIVCSSKPIHGINAVFIAPLFVMRYCQTESPGKPTSSVNLSIRIGTVTPGAGGKLICQARAPSSGVGSVRKSWKP